MKVSEFALGNCFGSLMSAAFRHFYGLGAKSAFRATDLPWIFSSRAVVNNAGDIVLMRGT